MKRFLTVLLAMVFTGCGSIPPPPEPTDPSTQETAATVADIVTEPQPITTTEKPEIPTVPPADDPESLAKRFISEVLVPNYGVSESVTFEQVDLDGSGNALPPPKASEGLISAVIRDFTGDGTPELVTVREQDWSYIIDTYTLLDDGYALGGTHTICTGYDASLYFPEVAIKDDHILVRQSWVGVPGYSRYGNGLTILGVTDHGFKVQGDFWGARYPGELSFSVNSRDFTYEEGSDTYDPIDFCQTAAETLDGLGMKWSGLTGGWRDDGGFGIDITFDGEENVFRFDQDSEGNCKFVDYTGLGALIN